jgi:pilus assembly protein CpaE
LVEYTTSKRQLSNALERAFDIAHHSSMATDSVMPVMSQTQSQGTVFERPRLGEVFTVASSSGGCGKTFYATNLACYLSAQTGKRVCLVDLDLQFGEVSTALHMRPRFTIADMLSLEESLDEDDLDQHIEEYLEQNELGFSVLAAPFSPTEAELITPKDVSKVLEALRRRFDYLVVDTPAQLSEVVLAAFDQSTKVLCMVTLDLPSIRNIRVFLSTLDKLRINGDAVSVVLNKVEDDVGIKIGDVQEILDNRIVSILPYSREVSRSINKGTPTLVSAADSEIGQKLAAGMRDLVGPQGAVKGDPSEEEPKSPRRQRRLRRNKRAPEHEMANQAKR